MPREISNQMLDRLVDGELNSTQFRSTLAQLEHAPDGWRRCALAFLEAQTWRRSLPQLTSTTEDEPTLPILAARRTSQPGARWGRWAAIAAAVMSAFWLGRVAGPQQHPAFPTPPGRQSAAVAPAAVAPAAPASGQAASGQAASGQAASGQAASGQAEPANSTSPIWADTGRADTGRADTGTVTLLPQLWSQPLRVPQDVRRSLRTLGMELRHHDGLVPAQNLAGQPVWLPYRDVTIIPVNHRGTF